MPSIEESNRKLLTMFPSLDIQAPQGPSSGKPKILARNTDLSSIDFGTTQDKPIKPMEMAKAPSLSHLQGQMVEDHFQLYQSIGNLATNIPQDQNLSIQLDFKHSKIFREDSTNLIVFIENSVAPSGAQEKSKS